MNPLRFLWRLLRLLLHTLQGIWISLTIRRLPTADGERLPDPEPIRRWFGKSLEILGIELICHGRAPQGPALVVANHYAWLDIPVIGACTDAAFLSKSAIRHWPLIGWFAKASSTLFIRRGKGEAKEVAAAIAGRLRAGRQVALFPEGRVGDGHQIHRFFPRLFAAAIDTGAPVVPVALRYCLDGHPDETVHYTPERNFLGILLRILGRKGSRVEVFILPPLSPQGKDRRALAEGARAAIQEALARGPACKMV